MYLENGRLSIRYKTICPRKMYFIHSTIRLKEEEEEEIVDPEENGEERKKVKRSNTQQMKCVSGLWFNAR